MPFHPLPTFARKDALNGTRYRQLRENTSAVQKLLRGEHIEASGEHNTPMVARTMGSLLYSAGYTLDGFNADVSLAGGAGVYNPAVGKVLLTLAANRYDSDEGSLMVQNGSPTGATKPCITSARFVSDTVVELYSLSLTSALNSANAWAAEDASVYVGVHSLALEVGAMAGTGRPLATEQGLRAATLDTNYSRLIQTGADLQVAFDLNHTDGEHDCREVAKCWAHIQWDGSDYNVLEQDFSNNCEIQTITRSGAGQLLIELTGAQTAPLQVFVEPDYAREDGGIITDHVIGCVPEDLLSTSDFELFLYERSIDLDFMSAPATATQVWNRADSDFYVWIYGG